MALVPSTLSTSGVTSPSSSFASSTPAWTASTEILPLVSASLQSNSIQSSRALNGTISPTDKPAPPPRGGGGGLSSGAIAGIVVGSVAAVALAAALVFWFFVRRRKSSKHQYAQAGQHPREVHEKGFSLSTISPSDGGATSVEPLPQPLEDQAIIGHVSKISNAIKNHVQSYYHNNHTGSVLVDHDALRALGSELQVSVETLTSLMENAATRETALRFAIALAVISRMQPSNDPSKSLLPTEIAQLYGKDTDKHPESQVQLKSMSHWRVMISKLSHSTYVRTPFDDSDSRHANIQALLALLDRILEPYADPRMNNEERRRNLEEVLKRAALFAFVLFSQPSTYSFEWQTEQSITAGELCIFPALIQLADETGQQISPPRLFSEAIIRRIDI